MNDKDLHLVLTATQSPDGLARIVAAIGDRELVADVCDLWSDADRDRVANAIHHACPAVAIKEIQRRLLTIDRENLPESVNNTESPWSDPEPLPDPLLEVMPYAKDLLPPAIGDAVNDIAERMQCPADYPAASMLVAMAAVIGCRIGIRPRRFDNWLVIPNLWGCVVGRPSMKKTPAIAEAEKRIRAIEARERDSVAKELESFEIDALVAESRVKAIKAKIDKAMKAGDEATARKLAQDIREIEELAPPIARRIITSDSTIEKLAVMLNKYPDGMLLWVDELLSWMRGLDRQDMSGVRQQYLTLWNGQGRLNIDRVSRGETVVERPCLSLFGCATPGGIGDYVAAAIRGGRGDDGLIQRLQILVWPDSPSDYRHVDRWPNSAARDQLIEVFERLADLDVDSFAERDKYDDGTGIPWLRFDSDGQAIFDRWDAAIQNRIRTGDLPEAFESHLSKYASLVPSIALVLHLAIDGRGPVSGEAAQMAVQWAEYLESHAARLYSIAIAPERRLAKPLLRRLFDWPKDKPIRARDIARKGWSGLDDVETVRKTIELLEDAGWVRSILTMPESGRPTTQYAVHPQAAEFLKTLKEQPDKTGKTPSVGSFVSFVGAPPVSIPDKSVTEGTRVRGVI